MLLMGLLAARMAWAETLEMVTYYPAPGATVQDLGVRSLTVGLGFAGANPGDGEMLVLDRVGIGTNAPAGPLHVVGVDDAVSSVVFMPGADTAAAGRPEVRVGIGTAAPQMALDVNGIVRAGTVTWVGGSGDVNGDGVLAPGDSLIIINFLNGGPPLPEPQRSRADVTDDGFVTAADVTAIQGAVTAGLTVPRSSFGRLVRTTFFPRSTVIPEGDVLIPAGNVGIGTNNPQARLDVAGGDIRATGAVVPLGGNGDVNGDGVLSNVDANIIITALNSGTPLTEPRRSRADVTADGLVTTADVTAIGDALNVVPVPAPMSAYQRLVRTQLNQNTLIPAGRVGIGTITPTGLLHATVNAADRFMKYQPTSGLADFEIVTNNSVQPVFALKGTGTADLVNIFDNTTEVFTILDGGNVGIGTTNPISLLHMASASTNLLTMESQAGGAHILFNCSQRPVIASNYGMTLNANGANTIAFQNGNIGNMTSQTLYNGTVRMIIAGNGNVGIGTTSPSAQLELSTDSAKKPTTNTWTIASDARIKTDIRPYTDGLATIQGIRPIWYQYNGKAGFKADGKAHIGVIAQEVQPVAPYTIDEYQANLNPEDTAPTTLLEFNSHALTFTLINAVKEQQKEIEELKARLVELEAKGKN